ncbi:MAG: hypothetical protein V3U75_12840 [Methylococcaceae bacterium]
MPKRTKPHPHLWLEIDPLIKEHLVNQCAAAGFDLQSVVEKILAGIVLTAHHKGGMVQALREFDSLVNAN